MKMYKIIAIDLDGTLLNSYGEVSVKNKEIIQKAVASNVEVVLASGRPVDSVRNLANELGANHYMICGNGAMLYDLNEDSIIYENFLDVNKVLQIIDICDKNSIYYNVYKEDRVLTKSLNYNVMFYQQENANRDDSKKTNIEIVQDIYNYVKNNQDDNYLKITICEEGKIIFNSIMRKIKEIKDIEILDVSHMSKKIIRDGTDEVEIKYFYTEISSKNVDKWFALEKLGEKLNVTSQEIMAIGDNVNDKMMMEKAGLGVAMGNSAPYIKEFADYITEDNNHDGVGMAIKQWVLCNNEK